jgi:hypothetical protein
MRKTVSYTIIINLICLLLNTVTFAKTYIVGPNEAYKKISAVVSLINHGDTIFVRSGIYTNDKQVTISKDNILIIGETGRPILRAGDIIANDQSNGKGIFVIKGNHVTIDNIAFYDAKVVDDNGAGIRQEGCDLKVLRCLFLNNEMGILCGTIPNCKTTIEYCEFYQNGNADNPGYQHNVYINNIDTLIFRFNISHNATAEGHELKSRAKFNYIAYNSISNFTTEDSRSIDLPNGGTSIILGNIIEQGKNSANNNILGYGLEGMSNPEPHRLFIVNNSFINRRENGSHIHIPNVAMDKFVVQNNVFVGGGTIINGLQGEFFSNLEIPNLLDASPFFESFDTYNYALVKDSPLIDAGTPIVENIGNYSLTPTYEFYGITKITNRATDEKIDIGAYEYRQTTSSLYYDLREAFVYPNPASDILMIDKQYQGQDVEVMSIDAKKQKTYKSDGQYIDISDLTSGMYVIKIGVKQQKIIKN